MKTIVFGNYKGGVGKTTSTFAIGEMMSRVYAKNVLLLDLDPQSSLTQICTNSVNAKKKESKTLDEYDDDETLNYVYDILTTKYKNNSNVDIKFDIKKIVKNINVYKQDNKKSWFQFIPSSLFYRDKLGLDQLNINMTNSLEYMSILRVFLDQLEAAVPYDYVLIDCPPSSTLITQGAFLASDYYVIPTILDDISSNGVLHYIETIKNTYLKYCDKQFSDDFLLNKHLFKNQPELLGVFYTMQHTTVSYDAVKAKFEAAAKNRFDIFENTIANSVDLSRKIAVGASTDNYEKLTEELMKKLNKLQKQK